MDGAEHAMRELLKGLRNWLRFWVFPEADPVAPLANGVCGGLCLLACGFWRAEVGSRCELQADWMARDGRFRRGDRFGVLRVADAKFQRLN